MQTRCAYGCKVDHPLHLSKISMCIAMPRQMHRSMVTFIKSRDREVPPHMQNKIEGRFIPLLITIHGLVPKRSFLFSCFQSDAFCEGQPPLKSSSVCDF